MTALLFLPAVIHIRCNFLLFAICHDCETSPARWNRSGVSGAAQQQPHYSEDAEENLDGTKGRKSVLYVYKVSLVTEMASSLKIWGSPLALLCILCRLLVHSKDVSWKEFMTLHYLDPSRDFEDCKCDALMREKAVLKDKSSYMSIYSLWHKMEYICIIEVGITDVEMPMYGPRVPSKYSSVSGRSTTIATQRASTTLNSTVARMGMLIA